MNEYARGWDDCLDIVKSILQETKDIAKAVDKLEYMHILVKEQKFAEIRRQLGVLEPIF